MKCTNKNKKGLRFTTEEIDQARSAMLKFKKALKEHPMAVMKCNVKNKKMIVTSNSFAKELFKKFSIKERKLIVSCLFNKNHLRRVGKEWVKVMKLYSNNHK